MKRIIRVLIFVMLSVAVVATLSGLLDRPRPSAPAQHQTGEQARPGALSSLTTVRAEMMRFESELRRDLAALRSQLARLNRNQEASDDKMRQFANHLSQAGLGRSTEAPRGGEAEPASLTPEQERERAEARAQAELALMEGTLHAEQFDSAWAHTAQLALNDIFSSRAIPGAQLLDTQCRTTLCRLELTLENAAAHDRYRELFDLAPGRAKASSILIPRLGWR